jgi:hypothetical protein
MAGDQPLRAASPIHLPVAATAASGPDLAGLGWIHPGQQQFPSPLDQVVTVSIERLELRATPPWRAPRPPVATRRVGLDEYAARRGRPSAS